jgi:hypothetical protein
MIVVGHKDKRVQSQAKHPNRCLQQLKKMAAILVIDENLAPLVAPRRDMIPTASSRAFSKAAP